MGCCVGENTPSANSLRPAEFGCEFGVKRGGRETIAIFVLQACHSDGYKAEIIDRDRQNLLGDIHHIEINYFMCYDVVGANSFAKEP